MTEPREVKNPKPGQCKAGVYRRISSNWGDTRQCDRKAKRDGWCGTHHPDAEATRRARSNARYDAQMREIRNARRRQQAVAEVIEAARDIESAADATDLKAQIVRLLLALARHDHPDDDGYWPEETE